MVAIRLTRFVDAAGVIRRPAGAADQGRALGRSRLHGTATSRSARYQPAPGNAIDQTGPHMCVYVCKGARRCGREPVDPTQTAHVFARCLSTRDHLTAVKSLRADSCRSASAGRRADDTRRRAVKGVPCGVLTRA